MKIFIRNILIFIVIITLNSCTHNIKFPNNMGQQITNIMRKLKDNNINTYKASLVNYQEYCQFKEEISKEASGMEDISEELFNKGKRQHFNEIISRGRLYKIKWNDINYISSTHETELNGKIAACYVTFEYENQRYKTNSVLIWNGNRYLVVGIEGPYLIK